MRLKAQTTLRVVLYEGPDAPSWDPALRFDTVQHLLEHGYAVTRVTGQGKVASAGRDFHFVLGQFPGGTAPEAGEPVGAARLRVQDVTGWELARIVAAVGAARAEQATATPGDWKPWFPVIDYERCTNCMQCLSFCLFGVYGVDEQQRIQVETAENCKTNCPACSRVCPEAAIIFPRYKAGPINGDVVSEADLSREKMKIDISALLGGDIYRLLRERSARANSRFSKERDSDKALQERQKCLAQLVAAADIPPEVLMSLPSPEEIQRRAAEAKARANAALNPKG